MIFEPELETKPRDESQALQTERLRALMAYVKERVPLYRERLTVQRVLDCRTPAWRH